MNNIYVLLPAYNEAENLPLLLQRFESELSTDILSKIKIILVNDGSSDSTSVVIKSFMQFNQNTILIEHAKNLGLTKALQSGIRFFVENGTLGDYLVTMDSDNTHMPYQINELYRQIQNNEDGIVIASRYLEQSTIAGVSNFRKFLSSASSIIFRCFVRIPNVKDYSCGYRIYSYGVVSNLYNSSDASYLFSLRSFACMTEIILSAYRNGAHISEIPMHLKYDQKRGVSKIRITQTIFETMKLLFHHYMCLYESRRSKRSFLKP